MSPEGSRLFNPRQQAHWLTIPQDHHTKMWDYSGHFQGRRWSPFSTSARPAPNFESNESKTL